MCKLIAIAVILIVGLSWTCYGGRIRKICNGHGRSRMHRNYTCCQNSGTGGWTPQPILPDHRCCPGSGRTFSESENQVCDNGRIREKTNPDETMCGVLLPYNVNSQVCCKTNITTARVYDKVPNGQCCNHDYLTDDSIRCCGGQTYDILNQTCCNSSETDTGVRLYNISNGKCCNDRPYDQTRQECNSDLEVVSRRTIKYCQDQPYNSLLNGCCVIDLYVKGAQLCHHETGTIITNPDPSFDSLCRDRTEALIPYTSGNNMHCIDLWGLQHLSSWQAVCGKGDDHVVYNTRTDLCCGSHVFHSGALSENKKCCQYGTNVYDPETQVCCRNDVPSDAASENHGGSCCDSQPYNNRTHECINGIEITELECPDATKQRIELRCLITEDVVLEAAGKFKKTGMSVTVATVTGVKKSKKRTTWTLGNVTQVLGKKKKIQISKNSKTNSAKAEAKPCTCPHNLIIGSRYLFISKKPMKKNGKLVLRGKEQVNGRSKGTDIVVNLSDSETLAMVMRILLD